MAIEYALDLFVIFSYPVSAIGPTMVGSGERFSKLKPYDGWKALFLSSILQIQYFIRDLFLQTFEAEFIENVLHILSHPESTVGLTMVGSKDSKVLTGLENAILILGFANTVFSKRVISKMIHLANL